MTWEVHDTQILPRVLIMVSALDHCLNDLLYRYRTGALRMTITAIVSNHAIFEDLARWHSVPFCTCQSPPSPSPPPRPACWRSPERARQN